MANDVNVKNVNTDGKQGPDDGKRARDLVAPIEKITIDTVEYPLVFNNNAARIAEDVYETQYGKDVGFGVILKAVAVGKYSAVMALFYGAMLAGGADIPWDVFDAKFKLDSVDGIRDILMRGMSRALPTADAEDAGKNP